MLRFNHMKYLILIVNLFLLVGCKEQQQVENFYSKGHEAFQKMEELDTSSAINIDVLGKQWDWIFTYPNGQKISCHESKEDYESWKQKPIDSNNPNDLTSFVTIPINTLMNLNISSEKVLHSLAIPAFRVKKDAPVGKTVSLQFTATKLGTYIYSCNEVCGIDHGHMVGYLRVVTKAEYERFLGILKKRKLEPNSASE